MAAAAPVPQALSAPWRGSREGRRKNPDARGSSDRESRLSQHVSRDLTMRRFVRFWPQFVRRPLASVSQEGIRKQSESNGEEQCKGQ